MIKLVPQERVQQRIVEQIVDMPVPQIMKDMCVAWEGIAEGMCEEIVGRHRSTGCC